MVPHFLRITHWTNEGAAFSLFADSASPNVVRWALIGFFVAWRRLWCCSLMVQLGSRFTLTTVALALIFAGAVGNVHDRIAYGSVSDFIEVHIFGYHWPDFNVADSLDRDWRLFAVAGLADWEQGSRDRQKTRAATEQWNRGSKWSGMRTSLPLAAWKAVLSKASCGYGRVLSTTSCYLLQLVTATIMEAPTKDLRARVSP